MMKHFFLIILCCFLAQSISAQQLKPIKKSSNSQVNKIENIHLEKKVNPTSVNEHTGIQYLPIHTFTGREDIKNNFRVSSYNNQGQANFIDGSLSPSKRSNNLQAQALDYIAEARDLMRYDEEDQFLIKKEWSDELGYQHLKFQQVHNQIPIFGSEIILHAKDNVITSLNGAYISTKGNEKVNPNPSIKMNQIEDLVKAEIPGNFRDLSERSDWMSNKITQWEKELVYYSDQKGLTLAYHVKVYPHLGEWLTYFIDAQSGEVITHYSNLCKLHAGHVNSDAVDEHTEHIACSHGEKDLGQMPPPDGPVTATAQDLLGNNITINTYEVGNGFYMIDGSRTMFNQSSSNLPNDPVGAIWTIDAFNTAPQNNDFDYGHVTSGNNNWNQNEAVSAHSNAGKSFEYFKNVHGRESIDGAGGTIISFVNVSDENGSSMGNAFWNGVAIWYGNGDNSFFPLGRGLDVAGHELSHGVVQKTANLKYQGESGAMNESFADIFGAMIDRDDWQIGEDVVRPNAFPSGALRDMQDPHNGAANGDFGGGFQPKHVNEMFTGPQDNGGVHINSGIPNHAFYLLATAIGKEKSEKIFYRALDTYLTMSSQFVDLRAAAERATSDLYGANELTAVQNAFNQVGIGSGGGGNYENDADTNPGQDFILYTDPNFDAIYLADPQGMIISNPLSNTGIASKPSVTDDGSEIVFIGKDKVMYIINIDWTAGSAQQNVLEDTEQWRNVIISKDGNRIAALRDQVDNEIFVFDFIAGASQDFELYNPTYTQGISTGDVLYADVMEFDITSNFIMYDAANEIQSQTAGTYEYWDIGFLEVWNSNANTWALGNIEKAFPALPEGTSVGNPTFAKNSPYIIAFDLIEDGVNQILGANLERGDVGLIYNNNILGYPSFSKDDSQIIFDVDSQGYEELGILPMNQDKISATAPSGTPWLFQDPTPSQWGVWFSNGIRVLSDLEDVEANAEQIVLFPNPAQDFINLQIKDINDALAYELYDITGKLMMINEINKSEKEISIDVSQLSQGTYILGVTTKDKRFNAKFVVNR